MEHLASALPLAWLAREALGWWRAHRREARVRVALQHLGTSTEELAETLDRLKREGKLK